MNLETNIVKYSVPAKIMLAGEYSVLLGGSALATTVEAYLNVEKRTSRLPDQGSHKPISKFIVNDRSKYHAPLFIDPSSNIEMMPKNMQLAARSVKSYWSHDRIAATDDNPNSEHLCELTIDSQIPISFGIGSSSALVLALCLATEHDGDQEPSTRSALKRAFVIQRAAQNQIASGYDFISQYCGGLVQTRPLTRGLEQWPGDFERVPQTSSTLNEWVQAMVLKEEGGAPTTPTVSSVSAWLNQHNKSKELLEIGDQLNLAFLYFFAHQSPTTWRDLCRSIRTLRQFFSDSPAHKFSEFSEMAKIRGCDVDWTFKTTGAGGRDAMLVIGPKESRHSAENFLESKGWMKLPFSFSDHGYSISKLCDQKGDAHGKL